MHTVRFFLVGFSISINGMLANSSVFIIVILLNKQEKETHGRTKQNHPFWLERNLPGPVDGFYAVRWMLPGEMETHILTRRDSSNNKRAALGGLGCDDGVDLQMFICKWMIFRLQKLRFWVMGAMP